MLLDGPRSDLSETELCWIGSWEEAYGEARPVARPARIGDSLFSENEMRGTTASAPRLDFLLGTNASEQADGIIMQCVRDLSELNCTRLGVIFPGGGALPRLVASALRQLKIPHNDGIAHIVPGIFESP